MNRKLTAVLALLTINLLITGCDNDNEKPGPEKQFLQKLSFTWHLQQARVNGVDVTRAFNGPILTIKGNKTFTVAPPVDPIWPASGSFTLREVSGSQDYDIVRNDGVELHVSELSASQLKLQMQYQPPHGRVSSVGGQYEFVFSR
ncbi:hypothetical protein KK083_32225 [Fulvivirgaceae bacterium PWU4]|uniref:Lipocalin-like domain-containing protein n=1 Tax=Chryseosolibacter histidini TaxID=2782349 RepID=A0AAP2GML6_9BACT|nr:hypothetical protein [Chryseosolibacter histidini]MBT1701601.1 hypothetical protein [Chryseosolibacter histidini]